MCNFFGSLNRFQAPEPPDRVGVLGNADADERPGAVSPLPWSVERSPPAPFYRHARVMDADGEPVTDYIAMMDAETIADAVNARAALYRTQPAALDVVTQNPPLPEPPETSTTA